MNIEELIGKSGDSELLNFEYTKNVLKVIMKVPDLNALVEIKANTRCIRSSTSPNSNVIKNSCYLELIDLKAVCHLNENNIFVPPDDFATMMKQARDGYNLVYGMRITEAAFMLRFKGVSPLLVCIVKSQNDIQWESIE